MIGVHPLQFSTTISGIRELWFNRVFIPSLRSGLVVCSALRVGLVLWFELIEDFVVDQAGWDLSF
jgi:hypothetical protein